MVIRIFILLVFIGTISGKAGGQHTIDFGHKVLLKTLEREGLSFNENVMEINVPQPDGQPAAVNGKFFLVGGDSSSVRYLYTGRVESCRAGGCSATDAALVNDSPEYFDYFILFNPDKSIRVVRVFNYQATHGQEVTARGWLKQFAGHNGSARLKVNKDIDAISGATISVNALVDDVNEKVQLLSFYKDGH